MSTVIDPTQLSQWISQAIGNLINMFVQFITALIDAIQPYVPVLATALVGIGIVEMISRMVFRRSFIRTIGRFMRALQFW